MKTDSQSLTANIIFFFDVEILMFEHPGLYIVIFPSSTANGPL